MERGYIENPQRLCGCFPPRGSTNAKMLQVREYETFSVK